jgi:hypothetical protein
MPTGIAEIPQAAQGVMMLSRVITDFIESRKERTSAAFTHVNGHSERL